MKDFRSFGGSRKTIICQGDKRIFLRIKDAILKGFLPDEDKKPAKIRRYPAGFRVEIFLMQNEFAHLGQDIPADIFPSDYLKGNVYSQFPSVDGSSIDPTLRPGYRSISSLDFLRFMTSCLSRPFK